MSLTASMEKDRLRDVLQETGLTQYEADTYITLLELGSAAATEIADACDVPQARIYDVLRKLEARGYVETYEDGNLYARAGDPSEVIADLDDYAETIADASDAVQERWERPTVENHQVSVVRPLSAIFDRSREAIEQAETEIQIALDLEQFFNFRDALATAYDRGVHIKLALSPGDNADIDPDELNIDFTGLATEVRYRRDCRPNANPVRAGTLTPPSTRIRRYGQRLLSFTRLRSILSTRSLGNLGISVQQPH